jgi:hypothetical protein
MDFFEKYLEYCEKNQTRINLNQYITEGKIQSFWLHPNSYHMIFKNYEKLDYVNMSEPSILACFEVNYIYNEDYKINLSLRKNFYLHLIDELLKQKIYSSDKITELYIAHKLKSANICFFNQTDETILLKIYEEQLKLKTEAEKLEFITAKITELHKLYPKLGASFLMKGRST